MIQENIARARQILHESKTSAIFFSECNIFLSYSIRQSILLLYLYLAILFGKHYKNQGIGISALWWPFWNNDRTIFL